MIALGIGLGIFVFFLVAPFVGAGILHSNQAGILPGIVGGIWTAWPFFHHGRVQRYNFLHPVPMKYKMPIKNAFSKVRDLLAELSYKYGDKWHVVLADPQAKRIVANLRFADEETRIEADVRGHISTRKERVQRFLELEIRFQNTDADGVVIQFDFLPKVEGLNFAACDSIVSGFCNAVEAVIGPGTMIGSPTETRLAAPPWWLLGITGIMLVGLMGDAGKELSAVAERIAKHPAELTQRQQEQDTDYQDKINEMAAWQKFKEANGL